MMQINAQSSKVSLLLSASSLALALFSIALAQQVNYLHYLGLFNAIALAIIALATAALLLGLWGTWRASGRGAVLWVADAVALALLGFYSFG